MSREGQKQYSTNSIASLHSVDGIRRVDIDIAKGLGIALVVIGHLVPTFKNEAIYLFHMPLFFILGGIASRQIPQKSWPSTKRLLLPYASFVFMLAVVPAIAGYLLEQHGLNKTLKELIKAAAGGELLVSTLGPVWFITCYAASRAIVITLSSCKLTILFCVSILFAFTAIALLVSHLFPTFFLPWALNIAPLGALLFYVGYLSRMFVDDMHPMIVGTIIVMAAIALIAADLGWIGSIQMKYGDFGTPGISLMGGVVVSLAVFFISRILATSLAFRPLAELGKASITIMYLHLPLGYLFANVSGIKSPYILVLATLLASIIAHFAFDANSFTRKFFLGR